MVEGAVEERPRPSSLDSGAEEPRSWRRRRRATPRSRCAAVAEALRPEVDLRDLGVLRIELPVGKVRAQQQERVAVLHRGVARGEADQAGHADVEGVVVFDMLLAAQRMDDRRVERAGKFDHLRVRAGAACAAHHGDALAAASSSAASASSSLSAGRTTGGLGASQARRLRRRSLERDVARDDHDRDAALGDGDADRFLKDARQVVGVGDQLDIMRCIRRTRCSGCVAWK